MGLVLDLGEDLTSYAVDEEKPEIRAHEDGNEDGVADENGVLDSPAPSGPQISRQVRVVRRQGA